MDIFLKHDIHCLDDPEFKKLVRKYHAFGYAVFFRCVEVFFLNESKPVEREELVLDVQEGLRESDTDKINQCIDMAIALEMFKVSGDKVYSNRVCDTYKELNDLRAMKSQAGKKGNEKRWGSVAQQSQKNRTCDTRAITKVSHSNRYEDEEEDEDKEEDSIKKNIKEESRKPDAHTLLGELKQFWNENCPSCPKALKLTITDEMNLQNILRDPEITVDVIQDQIKRIQKSDFATGNSDKGWKMTFNKFLSDFTGVLNGKYDGTRKSSKFKPTDLLGNHRDAEVQYVEEF